MHGITNIKHVLITSNQKSNAGFTLIELLISLVIACIVLASVYKIFISNNIIYLRHNELTSMEQSLRSALNVMTREIRMSGYNPLQNSTVGIDKGASSNNLITFSSYNESSDDVKEYMYYLYDSQTFGNNTLGRKVNGGTPQPLMPNVSSLGFQYCDKDSVCNATASNVSDISHVRIFLETTSTRDDLNVPNLNMNRTVYMRNACLDK